MITYDLIDYDYASRVGQLRACQIIALVFQSIVLYLESDRIGLVAFLFPFAIILGAVYHVGNRWFRRVDGRYDFRQVLHTRDTQLKATYAFQLFGGFVLSLLIHYISPTIHAGLHSIIYNLANFLSVFSSSVCLGIEIFESIRN